MRLEIKAQGTTILRRKLLRAADKGENVRPALRDISTDMLRVIRATFRSQGRRGGGSWKRLTPKWASYKAQHGLDHRILFATGRLERSFHVGGPEQDIKYQKRGFRLSSTVPYASVHQYGHFVHGIPARPYIRLTEYDKRRFAKILQQYMVSEFRSGRGRSSMLR